MDDTTLSLLTLFKERHTLNLTQLGAILNADPFSLSDPVHYLMSLGYIRKGVEIEPLEGDLISFDTPLEITYKGIAAISQALKERKNFKHTEFRAWVTLLIAIAATALQITSYAMGWFFCNHCHIFFTPSTPESTQSACFLLHPSAIILLSAMPC